MISSDTDLSTSAEKGSLQELAYAFLGIKGGSATCKFVQHLATHDDPASLMTILGHNTNRHVRKFAEVHVGQGHIQRTKKGRSPFYAMSASAREFCEEQRKNPSADTIKRVLYRIVLYYYRNRNIGGCTFVCRSPT